MGKDGDCLNRQSVAKEMPVLYIVIPCYNEEKVLPVTAPMFLGQRRTIANSARRRANESIISLRCALLGP